MNDYNKVILAYNGSSTCKSAMKKAIAITKQNNTELVVVSVIELASAINYDFAAMGMYTPVIQGTEFDEAQLKVDRTNDIKKRLADNDINNATIEVLFGDPADEIIEFTKANPNSLLIMSSSEKKEYEKWILGSVARKLSNAAPSDTLIVRKCGDE
jgi:nucleotide-binding universal stress UspA family protein